MSIEKHLNIDQVLLFKSGRESQRLGKALWAVLEEARRYFTPTSPDGWLEVPVASNPTVAARVRPHFRKWYVAPEPPDLPGLPADTYYQLTDNAAREFWAEAERGRGLYDHHSLGVSISSKLNLERAAVLVDQEIVPPSTWRYVIWNSYPGGAVISIAPIDPQYWGLPDGVDNDMRVSEVKRGARAATMSVVGSLLGLSRCDNQACFMFNAVDSVTRLAKMHSLGEEHRVRGLARGRFPLDDKADPNDVLSPEFPLREAP
jgi:hypothetical protein